MQPGFFRTLSTRLLQPCKSAVRHPSLIGPVLRGTEIGSVLKQHLAIHLQEPMTNTLEPSPDLINFTCQAIDAHSHACFRLGYLYDLCLRMRPEKVVETGVHHGVSTAFILNALKQTGGRLYSIDLPNVKYQTDNQSRQDDVLLGAEPGFLVPQHLRVNWELLIGDSRQLLPTLLRSIGPIDIFHHDSMHTYEHMKFEFEAVWPHLRDGGLLLSDDVDWSRAFEDFCSARKLNYRIRKGVGIAPKNIRHSSSYSKGSLTESRNKGS